MASEQLEGQSHITLKNTFMVLFPPFFDSTSPCSLQLTYR